MVNRTVAVIPARGGSKGIADKNIRDFEGKPLIAWTIKTALQAKGIDRVLVSTDSNRIAAIALEHGAEVPFMRPSHIATAETPIEPVLRHAYDWLVENDNYTADSLVLLFPTNPLRETRHIESALELFWSSHADTVLTASESPPHYTPYWTLIRSADGTVRYFGGGDMRHGYCRRQDFPDRCYAKDDLVFVLRPANLLQNPPSLYGKRVELQLTDRIYGGDINTPEDWDVAVQLFRYLAARKTTASS